MNEIAIVLTFDTEGPSAGKDGLAQNWDEVNRVVVGLDTKYRDTLLDSFGKGAIYSWFLLDWVGLSDQDSEVMRRNVVTGHHTVFDWYRKRYLNDERIAKTGDQYYWHYHHPFNDGSWGWNQEWNSNKMYEEVINKKIAERNFYPAVFASGGYVMSNECSRWLEKWIPFDYSSNAPVKSPSYNWSEAPKSWIPYHPSRDNYQKPGTTKRYLTRRKPTAGHYSALSSEDVEIAFKEANRGERPILSVITHDYIKSNGEEFHSLNDTLKTLARKYPKVKWRNRDALGAMRWSVGLKDPGPLELVVKKEGAIHTLEFSHAIYSEIPWIVQRKDAKGYQRIKPEILISQREYRFSAKERVSVGAVDSYGNTTIWHSK